MEEVIRSLEVDFDRDVLKVNGKEVTEQTLVYLPGPNGWELSRLFNPDPSVRGAKSVIKVTANKMNGSRDAEEKNELVHLRVVPEKVGFSMYLDDKYIHHIEKYDIEQSDFPGTAKLKIEMLVQYP